MNMGKVGIRTKKVDPFKWILGIEGAVVILFALLFFSHAKSQDLDVSAETDVPLLEHITQQELNNLVVTDPEEAFEEAFEVGDELFEVPGNELDGIGARVGDGSRFAKHPLSPTQSEVATSPNSSHARRPMFSELASNNA